VNRRIEVTEIQREIKRKKRVIEYAEKNGNIKTACRRFGIARSAHAGRPDARLRSHEPEDPDPSVVCGFALVDGLPGHVEDERLVDL
jgi:hypothetical protein